MKKLILVLNLLLPIDRRKPYRERLLKVNVINQPQNSESSEKLI